MVGPKGVGIVPCPPKYATVNVDLDVVAYVDTIPYDCVIEGCLCRRRCQQRDRHLLH